MKKGEIGISTLLLMIATILIVLVFLGIYLSTTNKLESQAYKTSEKTENSITTKVTANELASTYEGSKLQQFDVVIKPVPGSEQIYLDNLVIIVTTPDEKTTLTYNGTTTTHSAGGYYTLGVETYDVPSTLSDDIDMDGQADSLSVDANNNAVLELSTEGDLTLGNCSDNTTFSALDISSSSVDSFTGTCVAGAVANVTITPANEGTGYYTTQHLIQASDHLQGRITRGEVIKVYFETQNKLETDIIGSIRFILKSGSETELGFATPDVPRVGRVSLSHY